MLATQLKELFFSLYQKCSHNWFCFAKSHSSVLLKYDLSPQHLVVTSSVFPGAELLSERDNVSVVLLQRFLALTSIVTITVFATAYDRYRIVTATGTASATATRVPVLM